MGKHSASEPVSKNAFTVAAPVRPTISANANSAGPVPIVKKIADATDTRPATKESGHAIIAKI